jgi:predicted transcriptional regulator of viral defense system
MERSEAVRVLGEYAADQWGLVTTAQAKSVGVGSVVLLRLAEAGLLDRVQHGVYLVAGAAAPEHLELRAAWLRLAPAVPAWERYEPRTYGGVVSHGSACLLHKLGDVPADEVELTVPRRRTTREEGVHLRVGEVDAADVTIVEGLPTTTAERTIADLVAARMDGGHVGGVVSDADRLGLIDLDALAERVQSCARAYGLDRDATGLELIEHLVSQAGKVLHSQQVRVASLIGQTMGRKQALEAFNELTAEQRRKLFGLSGVVSADANSYLANLVRPSAIRMPGLGVKSPTAAIIDLRPVSDHFSAQLAQLPKLPAPVIAPHLANEFSSISASTSEALIKAMKRQDSGDDAEDHRE